MIAVLAPSATTSKRIALSTASQAIMTLVAGKRYMLVANQGFYFNQTGVSSAADGNPYVPANVPVIIDGSYGTALNAIGLVAGDITCTQVDMVFR